MKRNYCLSLVLLALFGTAMPFAANAAVESGKRFWYRCRDGR